MLSAQETSQLTQGAVCYIHTHPKDILGFEEKLELMFATPIRVAVPIMVPGGGSYTVSRGDELVLVDTSSSNVTVVLPPTDNGREFSVTKVSPNNTLFVVPTPPSTIIGAQGVQFTGNYTSLRIKAVNQNYILI